MTGRIVRLCCAVVLLSAPACTKKALQEIDAGGGGILPTGVGGAGNSGGGATECEMCRKMTFRATLVGASCTSTGATAG